MAKSLSSIAVRDEAKEVRPDARPQARGSLSFHVSRLTFHGSWERAEHDADGRGSFAAVERSMSDRLLGICGKTIVIRWKFDGPHI